MDLLDENFKKNIKLFSFALFSFFFASGIILFVFDINKKASALFFLIGVLSAIIHNSILNYLQFKKYESIENEFPEFMKNFSEMKRTGMTFPQTFEQISKSDLGTLSPYIKKTSSQISWGLPFPVAIKKLSDSIKGSKIIKQSLIMISEAFQMGGNVSELMSSLAKNISSIKEINSRRIAAVNQQIMIMYFIFFIFIITIIGVYKFLIPMLSIQIDLASPGNMMSGSSNLNMEKRQMPDFCSVPPIAPILCSFGSVMGFEKDIVKGKTKGFADYKDTDELEQEELIEEKTKRAYLYFKSLFFIMCLVQGICTGFIAGMLKTGKAIASLSHIGIMCISNLIIFILFV